MCEVGTDMIVYDSGSKTFLRDTVLLVFTKPSSPQSIWRSKCNSLYNQLTCSKYRIKTHLDLVPRLSTVELYLHSPIRLYGIIFN
jgi:hypothetical protein